MLRNQNKLTQPTKNMKFLKKTIHPWKILSISNKNNWTKMLIKMIATKILTKII